MPISLGTSRRDGWPENETDVRSAEDKELMRLVQQQDREALGRLFDQYSALVYKIAVRILRDPSEAQDVVQEVFLYVQRKSHVFDPSKGRVASWLIQVAYSRAFTRCQQMKLIEVRDCVRIEEIAESSVGDLPVERILNSISARDIVEQALVQLNSVQQQTLKLYLFEGYSLREIAVKLNENLSNTRHHYYRAIERLKQIVKHPR